MRLPRFGTAPAEAPVFVALLGSLLINITGQAVSASVADISGAVGASAGEGSWLAAAYSMALLVGISVASPLVGAFGLGRSFSAAALVFAVAGLACAAAPPLPALVALRAVQGLAAGIFSPVAFVAVFVMMRGPRLTLGLSLLAITLLLPTSWAPAVAGFVEDRLGWQALFHLQGIGGALIALLGIMAMPRTPVDWTAMRRDWAAVALMAAASAASVLVLAQGRRLYWLDSPLIIWSAAIAAGAWAGLLVTLARSPMPVLNVRLVASRGFLVPIALNLLFRVGFAASAFLIPQFLVMTQNYRPLELARLFLWSGMAQLIIFPFAYALVKRIDGRVVAAAGLASFGLAALLLADRTGLAAAPEFRLAVAAAGAGQVLFLVPNLIAGGRVLTPPDGPTATLMFNGTTVGGSILGIALATEFLTHRQRFHSARLGEAAGTFGPVPDKADPLAAAFFHGIAEDPGGPDPVALAAVRLGREAAVLSFNDAFLVWGALLLAATLGLLLLGRQPPLRRHAPAGESS